MASRRLVGPMVAAALVAVALVPVGLRASALAAGPWAALIGGSQNGTNSNVSAVVANASGDVYVGGGFYDDGTDLLSHIGKWNASSGWTALGTGMSGNGGDVDALLLQGSDLYAAGAFDHAGGIAANHVAKWNGTTWSALGGGLGDRVYALAYSNGTLYAAGSFTTLGDGTTAALHVAQWNGTTWSAVGGGLGTGTVYSLAVDSNGKLYAGGAFNKLGDETTDATSVAMWDGTSWSPMSTGLSNSVRAFAFDSDGVLYAGGWFSTLGDIAHTSAKRIAKWDGSAWAPVGVGFDNSVYGLSYHGGHLYAAGWFTALGDGTPANRVAMLDGSTWSAVGDGTDAVTYALATDGTNALYAGGDFTQAGGITANRIAKWTPSGGGGGGGGGGSTTPGTPTPTPTATPTPTPQPSADPLDPVLPGGSSGIPVGGLPAGDSLLLAGGQPVPVSVRPNAQRDPVALLVSAPTLIPPLSMLLEGRGDDSDPLGLTSKQALILQSRSPLRWAAVKRAATLQPVAQSSGDGFKASSPVRFYILPATYLGSLTTDATGAYQGSVPIPNGLAPGVYTLQANALAPDDTVRSLSIGVLVKSTTTRQTSTRATTQVFFHELSSTLTDTSKAKLQALVKKTGTPARTVRCVGFVQPNGKATNDGTLSVARARAVAAYLRSLGVRGAYVVRGGGTDAQGGATARRVDVTITTRR